MFVVSPVANADMVMFTVKRQYKSLESVIMSPLDATNGSFIMGFIVFVSLCQDTSQYGEGRNISVSCLRYLANHNALDSLLLRTMSFVKIAMFQKGRA